MNKLILLSFLILFAVPGYSYLSITPSSIDATLIVGTEKQENVTITNYYTFPIYDINFTAVNDTIMPLKVSELQPNQSVNLTIRVNGYNYHQKTSATSIIKFTYKELVNTQPQTKTISINSNGFSPQFLTITKGDSIKFINNHTTTANIVDQFNYRYFNIILAENATQTISGFNTVETFNYNDINDQTRTGQISVQEPGMQSIHNPNYNVNFQIAITSLYAESSIGLEQVPKVNVTVYPNAEQQIQFRVFNKGNERVRNVTLKSKSYEHWFTFEENVFDLDINQNKYVDVTIKPTINSSNDTNMTYSVDFEASALNANKQELTVGIFIPYLKNPNFDSLTREQLLELIQIMQETIGKIPIPDEPERIIVIMNDTVSLDKGDVQNILRDLSQRQTDVEGKLELLTKSINLIVPSIGELKLGLIEVNTTTAEANSIAKHSELWTYNSYNIILTALVITFMGIIVWVGIRHLRRKKTQNLKNHHYG